MSSEVDFRLGGNLTARPERTYLHPLSEQTKNTFHSLYRQMCAQEGKDPEPTTIFFKVRMYARVSCVCVCRVCVCVYVCVCVSVCLCV